MGGRKFEGGPPDPRDRNHLRRARRIRAEGKKAKPEQAEWLRRFEEAVKAMEGDGDSPAGYAASLKSEPRPPIPPEAARLTPAAAAPLEARAVEASSAQPAPVPGLTPTPTPGKVPPPPPPAPPRASSQASAVPGAAAPPKPAEGGLFDVANAEVQRAREKALRMIFATVADGFADLHKKVEATMNQPWVFPVEFWREAWLPMTVELFNRYLPDWCSGPIVEGVTVVMPPVSLVRAAGALEKAGYTVGVRGEPGRAVGGQAKAGEPAPKEEKKPEAASEATPLRNARSRTDSTANPPAKKNNGQVNVRDVFGGS